MGYNSLGAMEHDLKLETLLQHLGEETPFPYGSVTPPIVQTTLFTAPSLRMRQEHGGLNDAGYVYTRESNPTVRLAEQKLAALEQTEDALCFASGMAAIASAILTFTRTGDHVICVESAYPPTRMLLESWLTRYGVQASFIEGKCLEEFERALQPNTRLIYLESPSSLVFHLQDLRAVSQLARARGILTLCDNSWATPIFQNPHALGIDLVLHSASKYLGGHSDLLAGVVAGRREHIEQVRQTRSLLGGVLEPFGAWLLATGAAHAARAHGARPQKRAAGRRVAASATANRASEPPWTALAPAARASATTDARLQQPVQFRNAPHLRRASLRLRRPLASVPIRLQLGRIREPAAGLAARGR
jgi:cystathionine beta-lyase/cystathionine gamma-synthase